MRVSPIAWLSPGRLVGLLLLLPLGPLAAADIRVAVASNFVTVAQSITAEFAQQTGQRVQISSGSTGKLYAQIINGAPFDLFLAADTERPRRLLERGFTDRRVTYAVGQLVLWVPALQVDPQACRRHLGDPDLGRLAIANPTTAPYGMAARQTLRALNVKISDRDLVLGENIGQTFAFAYSGAVDAAFIAISQWRSQAHHLQGCHWLVPGRLHGPLLQQAVLLKRAAQRHGAAEFMAFLTGPSGRVLVMKAGYLPPP